MVRTTVGQPQTKKCIQSVAIAWRCSICLSVGLRPSLAQYVKTAHKNVISKVLIPKVLYFTEGGQDFFEDICNARCCGLPIFQYKDFCENRFFFSQSLYWADISDQSLIMLGFLTRWLQCCGNSLQNMSSKINCTIQNTAVR